MHFLRELFILENIINDFYNFNIISTSDSATLFVSQLWDINMDAGPVATFQVHEHLRPKVSCLLRQTSSLLLDARLLVYDTQRLVMIILILCSYVIYMKMTQSLTNSNVA